MDERTKELIAIGASVGAHCQPCLVYHVGKARELGIGDGMIGAAKGGPWGAGFLGIAFALSFCPISAALFFGSLVPLSIRDGSPVFYPLLFGLGTGLPVAAFAVMIAFGVRSLEAVFRRVTRAELWARRITGIVFIVAGAYYAAVYILEVL